MNRRPRRRDGTFARVDRHRRGPDVAEAAELTRTAAGAEIDRVECGGPYNTTNRVRHRIQAGPGDVAQATGPKRGADGRRCRFEVAAAQEGRFPFIEQRHGGRQAAFDLFAPVQLERIVCMEDFAGELEADTRDYGMVKQSPRYQRVKVRIGTEQIAPFELLEGCVQAARVACDREALDDDDHHALPHVS